MTTTKVRDVMSTPVITLDADATYKQAAELLLGNKVGALPVVDARGDVIGVVSESDLLTKVAIVADALEPGLLASRRRKRAAAKAASDRVSGLMSVPACTVSSEATVVEAAQLMRDREVKHLPVLDPDGALVGIVARNDLLHSFLRSDRQIRADVVHDVVESFLVADPNEVGVAVSDGVVTLSGELDNPASIPLAVQAARSVPGVVDVVDNLVARRDDRNTASDASPPFGPLRT
ncbi:CBS domain-containing protein [Actinocatenispora rupis]|uniref:BON domain-containing protein n=1 Tax=Actinocatenispora rupis TaxID=519421 RepID=A0A8J3JDN6_9ACTN|nr:CBS domain-containing protein [Actinocatenispora rupis]GID14562.1 hypothetical protein Aru02nite_54510 [Actinocatenispora rupis]